MENNLFRKKSLEHISSPEELHDYMRVTNPRLWMLLLAVVVILAGFIIYASTARMESTMKIQVEVQTFETSEEFREQGESALHSIVFGRLPESQIDTVKIGMVVRIAEEEGKVSFISAGDDDDEFVMLVEMDRGYILLPDGIYDAELVLESTTPISFLWN